MNSQIKSIVLLLFHVVLIFGCARKPEVGSNELESEFSKIIPISDMNKSLEIVVDGDENTFPLDSKIPLVIYNNSVHQLYFDNDTHLRLLVDSNNQWDEVKSALSYSGELMLLPKGTLLLDTGYTFARPVLDASVSSTNHNDILLRIVFIGEIMEGETRTGKTIGAFVDVFLRP